MVGTEFRENALRTEPSNKQYAEAMERLNERVFAAALMSSLQTIVENLNKLDQYKKYLIYNKQSKNLEKIRKDIVPVGKFTFENFDGKVEQAKQFQSPQRIRLLHGVIGVATESCEQIEALLKVASGLEPDVINYMEEVGGLNWYQELIGDTLGFTTEEANEKVIAQLRERYPKNFDENLAINRDVNKERSVLEQPTIAGISGPNKNRRC